MRYPQRPVLYAVENEIHISYRQNTSVEDWSEHCPNCDSDDTQHIADIIQFGIFDDKCTSIFHCRSCEYKFHWVYKARARASDSYLPIDHPVGRKAK